MQKVKPFVLVGAILLYFIGHFFNDRHRSAVEQRNQKESSALTLEGHAFNDTGSMLSILEDLRAGKTNDAIARVENYLYTDVYNIWYCSTQQSGHVLHPVQLERLEKIRAYNPKYAPNGNSPSMGQLIAEILSASKVAATK